MSEGHSRTGRRRGQDSQDIERERASERHSLSGERRRGVKLGNQKKASERYSLPGDGECQRRDRSGHGKKVSEAGALTNWRVQRKLQLRTPKERERARGTHELESAEVQFRTPNES